MCSFVSTSRTNSDTFNCAPSERKLQAWQSPRLRSWTSEHFNGHPTSSIAKLINELGNRSRRRLRSFPANLSCKLCVAVILPSSVIDRCFSCQINLPPASVVDCHARVTALLYRSYLRPSTTGKPSYDIFSPAHALHLQQQPPRTEQSPHADRSEGLTNEQPHHSLSLSCTKLGFGFLLRSPSRFTEALPISTTCVRSQLTPST